MSELPAASLPASFPSTIPMLSAPELFLAKMRKGHDHDAMQAASTILEGVFAAYNHVQKESAGEKHRKIAALRGRAARELLKMAGIDRMAGVPFRAIMDETLGFLMPELLLGWLAEDDEQEISQFEDELLLGHPHRWLGHALERDKGVYEGLAKQASNISHFPYHEFPTKLLRTLARANDGNVDRDMVDLVLLRFLPVLGHDWLSVIARVGSALYVQPGYVPEGSALNMTLDYAKAMGETYAARRSLSSELLGISYPREVSILGPHALRFSTEDRHGEGSNPNHYQRRFDDYEAQVQRWCGANPGFAVEIILTVRHMKGEGIWHVYECRIE